jgi:hypothetical protein
MKNFDFKYYWLRFKMEVQGGIDVVKDIIRDVDIVEDFKRVIQNLKEKDQYEAQQKRYRKQEILQPNDIVEFYDPVYTGNIVKGKVTHVGWSFTHDCVGVTVSVIETGIIRNAKDVRHFTQIWILNNLISIEQPNID